MLAPSGRSVSGKESERCFADFENEQRTGKYFQLIIEYCVDQDIMKVSS